MTYEVPIPTNFNPEIDDAKTIQDWLINNGCTPEYVSIVTIDGVQMLRIESETDPSPHLATFPVTEPPTQPQSEIQTLLTELETVQQKLDAVLAALGA